MQEKSLYNKIPIALKESEFNEFVLPHLKKGARGPSKKISFFKIFNYILNSPYAKTLFSRKFTSSFIDAIFAATNNLYLIAK